ncbi:MAG: anti-sigma factor [Opitutaceae bacterium]|jgi:anti-sigma-K factor RskA
MNPQLEELACFYVLDQLDVRERAAFEARLLNDPQLAALVRELESALARRIQALPQHPVPSDLLARIEARIDRLPAGETPSPARTAAPFWISIARWEIAAVIAIGVGTIAIQSLRHVPATAERPFMIIVGLDSGTGTLTELPMQEHPRNADARFIQLASLAEQFWENPEALPVKSGSSGQSGRGYALFDPGSNQGFIAIQQLPGIEQGKRCHLWILDIASGQTREAGILPLTDSNRGLYFFSVEPGTGAKPERLDFFVTAEDGASPKLTQPRGKVVLGGKRI